MTHTEVHGWNLITADCKSSFNAAPPVNGTFNGSVYVSEASLWAKKKNQFDGDYMCYTPEVDTDQDSHIILSALRV